MLYHMVPHCVSIGNVGRICRQLRQSEPVERQISSHLPKLSKLHSEYEQNYEELVAKMMSMEGSINATEAHLNAAKARANAAELELQRLRAEVERMKNGADLVKEQIVVMEKEIETGMEQARKEVKEEMTTEMRAREEKADNIVIYGAKESEADSAAERAVEDERFVRDMAKEIEVDIIGEIEAKNAILTSPALPLYANTTSYVTSTTDNSCSIFKISK